MRKISSDQKSSSVPTFHAQLPVWVSLCASARYASRRSNSRVRSSCSAIDITEQELLTRELERREAYLAEAQRLTHTGSWAWNVGTDELFWSEEIFRIYEIDPVKMKPTWSVILDSVHPDDRAGLERRKKIESEFDFRIVVSDWKIKNLHSISHPVMDGSGQVIQGL